MAGDDKDRASTRGERRFRDMTTKGLPKSGTTSFVSSGPPSKRDERPAVRMIAAISLTGAVLLCSVLDQKATDAHPVNILAVHWQFGENPVQHEVKPIFLWRTGHSLAHR